jgi:hypothetical protein
MVAVYTCATASEFLPRYNDNDLSASERSAFDEHLRTCGGCREKLRRFNAMNGVLQFTSRTEQEVERATGKKRQVEDAEELEAAPIGSAWYDRMGSAPWWMVSCALHILVIALASLISMSIELPKNDDNVIMVTELAQRPLVEQQKAEEKKADKRDALDAKETPATDPNSKEASEIVVPPDILAKAELGDHFETINPELPDNHSARGVEDAHSFHSVDGVVDAAGGGGTGGLGMDDLIGVGGAASKGTGGGWGGGDGTGIGADKGAGKGSFGNRNGSGRKLMVKRHGGSAKTEGAVDKALQWLAYHQENDGRWEVEKWMSNKEIRWGGGVEYSKKYVPGVTGLATLAFLGAGNTTRVGTYRENVKRAVAWMLAQQGPDGDFTAKYQPCHKGCQFYGHCICTLALAEALGMSSHKDVSPGDAGAKSDLQVAVEKGIELILKWQSQNTTGGWTYYDSQVTDPTVTGWAVMALKSAKVAGIHIPADSILKAREAVEKITTVDKTKGDYGQATTGYLAAGAKDFNSKGYACTAAGMCINLFLGVDTADDRVAGAAGFITQDDALPAWIFKPQDANTDHQNLYYWYYGTLGCFQYGGDVWKKWNEKMKAALVPNQCKDGDNDGSWDPDDCWGAWGGRVYSTALGCLSLEVYYRYLRLSTDK